ncbi:MAG TPA: hypothetical protein VG056_13020 [Pirellulales bacterium]|jgi:hypothetical protein|nr:hypothetical protein [Pirellulales bacterium]
MAGLKRALFVLLAVAGLIGSSGCCCCCSPCNGCGDGCGNGCGCGLLGRRCLPDDYRGGGSYWCDCGCGELYLGDWHSFPPERCDPCDCCGNYTGRCDDQAPWYQLGPRFGTASPAHAPPSDMSTPTPPPQPPTPPTSSSRAKHRGGAQQASYESPPHCAACGN